jgi:predicted acetylornithine/succinylornithine family transaminase
LNTDQCKETAAQCLVPNYGVRGIILVKGKGSRVWDDAGREYLDFLAGISVNNLGHCPDRVVEAVQRQVAELMHVSNLYLIPQQVELARRLCELCFAEKAFFANSGGEANEAAIKLARLYSKTKFGENRYEIITVRNSFHGRTLATLTATGQEKVQKGFEPLPIGFRYGHFNDIESVRAQVTEKTCAIMVEPVQGEGGVTAATQEFMSGLRELCDERNLLLIFDEIQCGMARCGKMFAHQNYGVEPDIMTLAKALGNGLPIGAMLTRSAIAEVFQAGTHGSTFGGGPVVCAAALAVLDQMRTEDIPARSVEVGAYLREKMTERLGSLPAFKGLRGIAMMIGIELNCAGAEIVKQCAETGLLINCTMGNVLRLLPPLTATKLECDKAIDILHDVMKNFPADSAA